MKTFFFLGVVGGGGGSGGLTFNILASYPGQEVEIFLVKECEIRSQARM